MLSQLQCNTLTNSFPSQRILIALTPNKQQQRPPLQEKIQSSMKTSSLDLCKYDEYMQENILKNSKKVQQHLKKKEQELEKLRKQNQMTLKKAKNFLCPKPRAQTTVSKLKPKLTTKKQKANIEQKHYRMITDYMNNPTSKTNSIPFHHPCKHDTCSNYDEPNNADFCEFYQGSQFMDKENAVNKEGHESWIVSKILIDLNDCDESEKNKKSKEKNEIQNNLQTKKKKKKYSSRKCSDNKKQEQSKSLYNHTINKEASSSSLNNCLDKFQQVFQKAQELLQQSELKDQQTNNYCFLNNNYYFSPEIDLFKKKYQLNEKFIVNQQNSEQNLEEVFDFESFSIEQKESNESQGVYDNNFINVIKERVIQEQQKLEDQFQKGSKEQNQYFIQLAIDKTLEIGEQDVIQKSEKTSSLISIKDSENQLEQANSVTDIPVSDFIRSVPSELILKNIINQYTISEQQPTIKPSLFTNNIVSLFSTNKENRCEQCKQEQREQPNQLEQPEQQEQSEQSEQSEYPEELIEREQLEEQQMKQNESAFNIYKIDEENEDECDSLDEFGLLPNDIQQQLTPVVEYLTAFQELIPDSSSLSLNEQKIKLKNGLIYEGEISESQQLTGYGILSLEDKDLLIYEGQFSDNQFNSRGKLVNIYSKPSGNGIVNYNNLDTLPHSAWLYYQGQFENGKFNGYGVLAFNNDQKLHGQFVNAKVSGSATIFDMKTNEAVFSGEYEDNQLLCKNF